MLRGRFKDVSRRLQRVFSIHFQWYLKDASWVFEDANRVQFESPKDGSRAHLGYFIGVSNTLRVFMFIGCLMNASNMHR